MQIFDDEVLYTNEELAFNELSKFWNDNDADEEVEDDYYREFSDIY